MAIGIGDTLPSVTFKHMTPDGPADISTEDVFAGKKVVLFAVPGAFTPSCSLTHLPGFVASTDAIKGKGVDTIVCTSVNDAYVMGAWGEAQNADRILMLADPDGAFAKAAGLSVDLSQFGLGLRSQRYALIVEDGTVSGVYVEPEKGVTVSSAESVLKAL